MILRLSHNLNQKLKTGKLNALPLHQNPFADWTCRLFFANHRQYIILSNSKTLYSCVMPGKGNANQTQFAKNALNCIRDFTAVAGRQAAFQKFIAPEGETIQIAKALNRSVTSSMNQLVECAEYLLIEQQLPLDEVSFELNDFLLSSLVEKKSDGYDTPENAFQRLEHQLADAPFLKEKSAEQQEVISKKQPAIWYVYLLLCGDGSLYTGITTDLTRRCEQHNAGTGARYTRSRLPVRMVYHEIQATHSLALKRELAIKALSRTEKEALIKSMR